MAFGSILRLQVGELIIELAPLNREVMGEFISPGVQQASVTQYLTGQARVLEDEYEWYDKVRTNRDELVWGIWNVSGNERLLIGSTGLHDLTRDFITQATSGSLIFRKEYWGKGIASAIHKARTWYAFQQLGLDRIASEVIQGNIASRKALEKSGYYVTHVKRNAKFVNGKLCHIDQLECINPASWKRWWSNDRPTKAARDAQLRTKSAMLWASENVTLP